MMLPLPLLLGFILEAVGGNAKSIPALRAFQFVWRGSSCISRAAESEEGAQSCGVTGFDRTSIARL